MVQWLRLHAPTTGAWNPSLKGELRSCMPCNMAKKDKLMHLGLKSLLVKKGEVMLTLLTTRDREEEGDLGDEPV